MMLVDYSSPMSIPFDPPKIVRPFKRENCNDHNCTKIGDIPIRKCCKYDEVSILGRSPAFLTSDVFIRSNEIMRTKWPIY